MRFFLGVLTGMVFTANVILVFHADIAKLTPRRGDLVAIEKGTRSYIDAEGKTTGTFNFERKVFKRKTIIDYIID